MATLEDKLLERLIQSCVAALNPVYGIGFHREHDKGPGFYAIGLNYVTIDNITGDEDADAISRWGDVGMANEVYREGFIRDVYPRNYLTDPQLAWRVGNQTLEQWISSEPSRGELSAIGNRMMLWRIETQRIDSIRGTLSEAGIIFDWEAYLREKGS